MRSFKVLILAATCLAAPCMSFAQERNADPWESANRRAYALHENLDQHIFEPIARGYRAITPRFFRKGVRNFLHNLSTPVTLTNDLLQGELKRAGTTAARFGVNSTIGVLGVMDPATDMGLERHTEDFGQTLAVWGVPSGPYVFTPILGPTTVRDGLGNIVDLAFDPLNWADFNGDTETRIVLGVTGAISAREGVLDAVDDLRNSSLDPYVSYRSTYFLFRESAIRNGRQDVQDLPDFESIPDYPATGDQPAGAEAPEGTASSELTPEGTNAEPGPSGMNTTDADAQRYSALFSGAIQ